MKLRVGSRGSNLALWQAGWVKNHLEAGGCEVEIKIIKTSGDTLASASLIQSGIKGLFVKEIEEALLEGTIDLAVHSLKDLPLEQPEGLFLAAFPPREDARDVLISRNGRRFEEMERGAKIGTSSLRRQSQLHALRQDLQLVPMRGNLTTRIDKLDRGECDGLVLAAAGLRRLELDQRITRYFSPEELCPAAGQGALALEVRRGDQRAEKAVRSLDDSATRKAVSAERTALLHLGGGCETPIAAYARIERGRLKIIGVVAAPDGTRLIRAQAEGPAEAAEAAGAELASHLAENGAQDVLRAAR